MLLEDRFTQHNKLPDWKPIFMSQNLGYPLAAWSENMHHAPASNPIIFENKVKFNTLYSLIKHFVLWPKMFGSCIPKLSENRNAVHCPNTSDRHVGSSYLVSGSSRCLPCPSKCLSNVTLLDIKFVFFYLSISYHNISLWHPDWSINLILGHDRYIFFQLYASWKYRTWSLWLSLWMSLY